MDRIANGGWISLRRRQPYYSPLHCTVGGDLSPKTTQRSLWLELAYVQHDLALGLPDSTSACAFAVSAKAISRPTTGCHCVDRTWRSEVPFSLPVFHCRCRKLVVCPGAALAG